MKNLILMFLIALPLYASDPWFGIEGLNTPTSSWSSTDGSYIRYDKVEHLIRGGAIFLINKQLLGCSTKQAYVYGLSFSLLWEIKDGLMDWQDWGAIGDGQFSWKDIVADCTGMFFTSLFYSGEKPIRLRLSQNEIGLTLEF